MSRPVLHTLVESPDDPFILGHFRQSLDHNLSTSVVYSLPIPAFTGWCSCICIICMKSHSSGNKINGTWSSRSTFDVGALQKVMLRIYPPYKMTNSPRIRGFDLQAVFSPSLSFLKICWIPMEKTDERTNRPNVRGYLHTFSSISS